MSVIVTRARRAAGREATERPGLLAAGRLAPFFRELAPDWHSDWAWENYEATVLRLAGRFGLTSLCEIGGGRDPLFLPGAPGLDGLKLTVNDIDAGELAAAPDGLSKARFDIAGDLSEPDAIPGSFDLMFSRMVFEHVDGVPRAWRNIHALLKPGGVALAFFPTLWAPVFTLNRIIPERASRAIVHALFPARRDGGDDPKFPALYDHCRGSGKALRPMLAEAGFRDVLIQPFWGHGYFKRMPGLREADHAFNRLAAALDWRLVTTYAYVVVRKDPL